MAIWNKKNEDKDYLVAPKTSGFTCDLCGKTYTSKWELQSHEVSSHTNVRWQCDKCDKSYTRQNNLNAHKRKVHEN